MSAKKVSAKSGKVVKKTVTAPKPVKKSVKAAPKKVVKKVAPVVKSVKKQAEKSVKKALVAPKKKVTKAPVLKKGTSVVTKVKKVALSKGSEIKNKVAVAAKKSTPKVKKVLKKVKPIIKAVKKSVKKNTVTKSPVKSVKKIIATPKVVKEKVADKKKVLTSKTVTTASAVSEKPPLKFKKIKIDEVPIPKFKAKGVVPYTPEHTQSILERKQESIPVSLVKYNDSDLEEFKEIIDKKLEEAKSQLLYLQKSLSRGDNMGDVNTHDMMDGGSFNAEKEQLMQLAKRCRVFIDDLEKALIRIENKTYGICRITGKLIDKDRLRAVPHATLSVEAKMNSITRK